MVFVGFGICVCFDCCFDVFVFGVWCLCGFVVVFFGVGVFVVIGVVYLYGVGNCVGDFVLCGVFLVWIV